MRSASTPKLACPAPIPQRTRREAGAVLLEVVLALALFVVAASILTGGMSSSLDALERLRLNAHAADLAVTVLSEFEMGVKSLSLNGPEPFDLPLEQWSWEVIATPLETDLDDTGPVQRIEIVIRNDEAALVYRLTQLMRIDAAATTAQRSPVGDSAF